MRSIDSLPFDNCYARLHGEHHGAPWQAVPLRGARLLAFNADAAALIGLDPAEAGRPEFLSYLGGALPLPGAQPRRMPQPAGPRGDPAAAAGGARGVLLGEVGGPDGRRWDLHLVGGGQSVPGAGGGDRLTLDLAIRQYLGSEALHGLGLPTSRALCLIGSDEPVDRDGVANGVVLVCLTPGSVRCGDFELFRRRGQVQRVRELADYLIERHFPALRGQPDRYAELLAEIVRHTAQMLARWQLLGFCHGAPAAEAMSVVGIALGYGSSGFMPAYDPGYSSNRADRWRRYAFARQPQVAARNLAGLGQAWQPLLDAHDSVAASARVADILACYEPLLADAYDTGMRHKLGLSGEHPDDRELVAGLLERLHAGGVDYTGAFRALGRMRLADPSGDAPLRALFPDLEAFAGWAVDYRARLRAEGRDDAGRRAAMASVNPGFVLRASLLERVIARAELGDYAEFEALRRRLAAPYAESSGGGDVTDLAAPPAHAHDALGWC